MYKQQSQTLERQLAKTLTAYAGIHVEIGTVDSFQGREKDAVILTFSETDPKRRRFFYDRRRLNVALSRSKEMLVIIGSIDKLGAKPQTFGVENPLFKLHFLTESGVGVFATKEEFHV
jgi:superfamily I DNA and/or RNA helicase